MPKKTISIMLLAGVAALLLVSWAGAATSVSSTLPPYTGIIRNNTPCEYTIPSQNSMGTLIVPARGWIEFTVWDPKFDVIPYYSGKPYGCQKVTVTPKAFNYMCKNYDFMVDISGPGPCPAEQPAYYKKYKKRVRKKRPC